MLNQKKFAFRPFQFDLFRDAIDVPEDFTTWCIFHEVYERDGKLQGHIRKVTKITYQATHPRNNKQSVQLALPVFHETVIVAIKSHFPNLLLATNT